ncbi:MAG: YceI family protein [Acinetobacter populi]|jgi:polyisoprenoid-binding protein YceI|uniref:YceI family protein n=1 Tax=Acinetobacter populi TaxID=1582270 RepID=UPI00235483FD|nr:YceI family protein [Acinetobacter populi]MCH4246559.1 YceI family protein [Acinetobacter populi]
MNMPIIYGFAFATLSIFSMQTYAAQWNLDGSKSNVGFTTQGTGGTKANFNKVQGNAVFDPKNIQNTKINLEINASSLSAGIKTPLYKGSNGLNVSKYPKLTFKSTAITALSGNRYKMDGLLTMHGITKPTTWTLNINPEGDALTMTASTQIDRTQWGMTHFENLIDETITLNAKTKFVKVQ